SHNLDSMVIDLDRRGLNRSEKPFRSLIRSQRHLKSLALHKVGNISMGSALEMLVSQSRSLESITFLGIVFKADERDFGSFGFPQLKSIRLEFCQILNSS